MLLRYFTQNNRGLLFFYPIIIGLLSTALIYFLPSITHSSPLYASGYIFETQESSIWIFILVTVITATIFAGVVNKAFNSSELYFQPSFLVGFLSSIVFTISCIKIHSFSWSVAQLFLAFALFFSLQIQNQKRIYPSLFLAQISVGISICIFPQNIGFGLALTTTLLMNRSFSIKELLFSLFTIIIPLLYWLSYSFITDQLSDWFFWSKTPTTFPVNSLFSSIVFWVCSVCLLSSLVGIFKKENRQTNKTQQAKNTLLIFLFSSILSSLICWITHEPFTLYNFSLPFILIVGYYWTHYRVSLMAPFLFYLWIITHFLFAFEVIH